MSTTKAKLRQYYAAISATIPSLCFGLAVTWTSPLASRLQGQDPSTSYEPLERPLTGTELSWVSSLMPLGAILGSVMVGFAMDRFGRKKTLLAFGGIPCVVGWIVILNATSVYMLYTARLLIGVSSGVALLVGPTYIAEFASPSLRGSLCAMFQIMLNLGVMVPYCIGPYTSYFVLAGVSLLFPLAFLATFLFLPETPFYLISKQELEEAAKSLAWFTGEKQSPDLSKQRDIISSCVHEASSVSLVDSFKELFSSRGNRRALMVVSGLMFAFQFCGINAILFNLETVFRGSSKTNKPWLGPSESAIVTGVVQNVSTWVAAALVDKVGRRPLLLVSTALATVGIVGLGVQSFLEENKFSVASDLTWMPVACLMLFVSAFCVGLGPLSWIVMSELFTGGAKSAASLLGGGFSWLLAFVVTLTFSPMEEYLHFYGTYWVYSVCCALGFFFTAVMLPETKCKTLENIHEEL
ncbi:facilitated trehalose transporter Tret1-like [Ischnura elegans]|uniref:facilitated trehalose transporter Tret1-like n=1 Tax=Ischnura elegans TaxID=197161 RepID=UPI001ED8A1C0|nr:facilitated trehalose transporter Tret1-like [Ischnura elegans]